jgi:hypothetical protein
MEGMVIHLQKKEWKLLRDRPRGKPETAEHTGWPTYGLIALAILLTVIITPAAATDPTVIIADYTVSPAVLMPGDMGIVTLTIKNTALAASEKENTGAASGGTFANTKSTDINVYIENVHLDENGISVINDDFDRIGELGPGQSVPVTFVIKAPEKSGIYFPEVWIDVKDGRSTRFPVLVNVNTDIATQKKPSLTVSRTLPGQVTPGDDFSASLILENTGLTRASDISIIVTTSQKSVALASTGRYYVADLDPGEKYPLDLQFTTDRDTPVGINPVTLTITYTNPGGIQEKQTETLGVPFKGKAEIAVSSVTTDPVRPVPGSPFTLILRIENTGTERATSVRATLDSPFAGSRDSFIGSIDKDSDAPAIFYLQATKDGTVPVNLTISYTDDFGSHTISERTTIVTSPASSTTTIVLAVLLIGIIAGAGYWYLRIRPGKRHAE